MQVEELNVPDDAGESLKVTVPVGVKGVPELVSVIVTVQVEAAPTASGKGEQDSVVELLLIVDVTETVLELEE